MYAIANQSFPWSSSSTFTIDLNQYTGYCLQLFTRDPHGSMDSIRVVISVIHTVPTAEAGCSITTFVGQEIQFNGTGSFDADGDELQYLWDFNNGDGIQVEFSGPNPIHIFRTAGIHTVTLRGNRMYLPQIQMIRRDWNSCMPSQTNHSHGVRRQHLRSI